jgi:hypothetical protein
LKFTKKARKPLMAKKNKKAPETSNKLDWHKFNFLENLFIFCAMKEKAVPKESGVHFRITPNKDCDCVCLLFKIDRPDDPLIRENIKRPDFLALYIDRDTCLFTIIEMKGTTLKGGKHGVEQIITFRDYLKREIGNNLPTKFKPRFQAIILTPYGTQTPNELIARVSSKDFTVRPLQYQFKAELFEFVSQDIKKAIENKKSGDKHARHAVFKNDLRELEEILTRNALSNRKDDDLYKANKDKAANKDGIYINYALLNKADYAALIMDNSKIKIGVKESGNKFAGKIESDLKKLRLETSKNFEIVKIK